MRVCLGSVRVCMRVRARVCLKVHRRVHAYACATMYGVTQCKPIIMRHTEECHLRFQNNIEPIIIVVRFRQKRSRSQSVSLALVAGRLQAILVQHLLPLVSQFVN